MCPVQYIKVIVIGKRGRIPVRRSGVARHAIRRQAQFIVVWIGGLIKIHSVTCKTSCWRSCITVGVTSYAFNSSVRLSQREVGVVMIEGAITISCWVTGKTCCTGIGVSGYLIMLIVCIGIGVTGDTGKFSVVRWILVTVCTIIPFAIV